MLPFFYVSPIWWSGFIGGVGLILETKNKINHLLKKEKNVILQVGKTFGHLYQSLFFKDIYSIIEGPPPEINLSNEKNNGETVLKLINSKLITSAHDISSGGLILALAEMCLSSGLGLKIEKPSKLSNLMEYYFGEDQGRYLIEVEPVNLQSVTKTLNENNISKLTPGDADILTNAFRQSLSRLMSET